MLPLWWLAVTLLLPSFCHSQTIRDLPGFTGNRLPPNDDGSSGPAPLGFEANFFGHTYRTVYVNNNGNITFQGPLSTFVPFGLSGTNIPIIAAFFADVDTRAPGTNAVTYGVDTINGHRAFGVNYFRVGYYSVHNDRLNTFQLILIERLDTGAGNFDIEFNYRQIQWDLGDAGRGRGDIGAVVGFSNGRREANSLFELPGSKSAGSFVDGGPNSLVAHRLNSEVPGRYVFQARSGVVSVLRITTTGLPEGTVAQPYSAPPLTATGGTPPYSWSTVNWPPELELRLDPTTGNITGTPTRAGEYQVTIQVVDQVGTPPARQTFPLRIVAIRQPAIAPFLIEPREASVGVPIKMIAGLKSLDQGPATVPPSLLMRAQFAGQTVTLRDDGQEGDEVRGDGRYTANVVFRASGDVPITLQATNGTIDAAGQGMVKVWGRFNGVADPIDLDLGELKAGTQSCRPFRISVEQQGDVSLELRAMGSLPAAHNLILQSGQRSHKPGQLALLLSPADEKQVCLATTTLAPSSEAHGEPWLMLMTVNTHGKQDLAAVRLKWRVHALTFWDRWGVLLLLLLVLLITGLVIYGYIKPSRFPRDLAITFVPDYEDLDTQPQPIAQWPGVGIGFYRDALAYLHPDFRISGKASGALAVLRARAGGLWIAPVGSTLYREIELSEWEEIAPAGRDARTTVVYRAGDRGPFFRISSTAKRRNS